MRPRGGGRASAPVGGRNGGGRPMNGEKGAARNGSGFGMFSSGEPGKGSGDGAVFSSAPSTEVPLAAMASITPGSPPTPPPPLAIVVSLRLRLAASANASSQRRSDWRAASQDS